jgi:hypothetical protein
MAGKSLSMLLAKIKRLRRAPSFLTPDLREVFETDNKHPRPQCRLDTMFAGALCTVPFDDRVIPQTESQSLKQACDQTNPDHALSFRPKCWLKQSDTF